MTEIKGNYQIIAELRAERDALVKALKAATEAIRSSAGPEERMNAEREGRRLLASVEGRSSQDTKND